MPKHPQKLRKVVKDAADVPTASTNEETVATGKATKSVSTSTISVLFTAIVVAWMIGVEYKNTRQYTSEYLAEDHGRRNVSKTKLSSESARHTKLAVAVDPDMHSSHLDIVDLLDWEERSLQGLLDNSNIADITEQEAERRATEACQTPPGIPETCCLGSFSSGGAVQPRFRNQCSQPMQNLGLLQQATHDFFEQNPVTVPNQDNQLVKCDVCQIMDLARQHNLSIVLIGDSMQLQVMDGLICELTRRHFTLVSDEWVKPQNISDELGIYHKHSNTRVLRISSPLWNTQQIVTIRYHQIYMVPLNEVGGDFLALTAEADILVLGFGLHWSSGPVYNGKTEYDYVRSMSETFTDVSKQGRVKLLVHRESSAEHFDTDHAGEWNFWDKKPAEERSRECHPTSPANPAFYWRENAIARAANRSGHSLVFAGPTMPPPSTRSSEVVVLPYYNFTSKHPHMHPHRDGNRDDDCAHFCGSPYLYYPLWRSLRFAMDRSFL